MTDIHSCSYHCDRPACIKAQRDELRERLAQPAQEQDLIPQHELFVCAQMGAHVTRVRLAPAQEPLTEAQIVDAIAPLYQNRALAEMAAKIGMDDYRAIEQAHGIGAKK